MNHLSFLAIFSLSYLVSSPLSYAQTPEIFLEKAVCSSETSHALIIHGGVTYRNRPERDTLRQAHIHDLLIKGQEALRRGVPSLDVISYTLTSMENSGAFNAGTGSIPNQAGEREMDASIMTGHNQKAGAVASVRQMKNPILGARYVMEQTKNVFFVGTATDQFLEDKVIQADLSESTHHFAQQDTEDIKIPPHGTIGAVALDICGNISAGTSTGGFGSKIPGRVGDSPVIGAGTYANNQVGISASGHGEYFIRYAIAHDISARIKYLGDNLKKATTDAIEELTHNGGTGGVIALNKAGDISIAQNTHGFIYGYAGSKYPDIITSDGTE
ncbi:isoaspartyl peptidase/L-asparaginase family protein [Kiloniella majae]|uniref:isoaspartyl peptidase/L-asparaginase family protein n=1 Tax=Kiloniella majae TaxID=1938558 RepID=UPI0015C500AE|nr:isoaspartyl peptidase/L-asparaginase [Kiloniella majae]